MTEQEASKAADELHDAILTMETVYQDITKYLEDYAGTDEGNSDGYALLETVKDLMMDIGRPYTTLSRFTNE